jgi:hypothetical protein
VVEAQGSSYERQWLVGAQSAATSEGWEAVVAAAGGQAGGRRWFCLLWLTGGRARIRFG